MEPLSPFLRFSGSTCERGALTFFTFGCRGAAEGERGAHAGAGGELQGAVHAVGLRPLQLVGLSAGA
eukprot:7447002-Pyramimonas_sp.AAC.1